ncbi:hypothetical protein DFA_03552 [Cavenderia fasciculata]|uniref:Uncharacterized protein n=1 Tax=Cavenderia fasciculata TaxID=261658 RepID=F4PHW9_CACFS|nr:uncharacterized protein DFA_03552 [Cavenderia fasciculata]EGG25303.1 hypothetical protein DFA_03552 [Cavenderia fasciculata]|eukprot:XP_004363154.1 hypothetical protein DFA_03552 [Cavenderia fasciculata]
MRFAPLFLLSLLVGSITAQNCYLFNQTAAKLDQFGPAIGGDAVYFADSNIPGGKTGFVFNTGSAMSTTSNGKLVITGTMVPTDGSKNVFYDARFSFNPSSQAFTPKLELQDAAYVQNGGPVNPASFTYYTLNAGDSVFVGHGDVEGVTVNLAPFEGMPLQSGVGANGKNVNNGVSGWFAPTFMKNGQQIYASSQVVDINVDSACDQCVSNTLMATQAGGQSVFIQGDTSPFGGNAKWDFINNSGSFAYQTNGDLLFTGSLVPVGANSPTMTCSMLFHPNTNNVQPKKELSPDSYFPNGPVDTNTWVYYNVDTTQSSCTVNGNTVTITGDMGIPLQVGNGANGKNTNYGASVWLEYNGTMDIFDINVDLVCVVNSTATPVPTVTPTPTPNSPSTDSSTFTSMTPPPSTSTTSSSSIATTTTIPSTTTTFSTGEISSTTGCVWVCPPSPTTTTTTTSMMTTTSISNVTDTPTPTAPSTIPPTTYPNASTIPAPIVAGGVNPNSSGNNLSASKIMIAAASIAALAIFA